MPVPSSPAASWAFESSAAKPGDGSLHYGTVSLLILNQQGCSIPAESQQLENAEHKNNLQPCLRQSWPCPSFSTMGSVGATAFHKLHKTLQTAFISGFHHMASSRKNLFHIDRLRWLFSNSCGQIVKQTNKQNPAVLGDKCPSASQPQHHTQGRRYPPTAVHRSLQMVRTTNNPANPRAKKNEKGPDSIFSTSPPFPQPCSKGRETTGQGKVASRLLCLSAQPNTPPQPVLLLGAFPGGCAARHYRARPGPPTPSARGAEQMLHEQRHRLLQINTLPPSPPK